MSVRKICRQISYLAESKSIRVPGSDSWIAMKQLFTELQLLINRTDEVDADYVLSDSEIRKYQPNLQRLRASYESQSEVELATDILNRGSQAAELVWSYMRENFPFTTIHTESFKQNVSGKTSCLIVGCGAFPTTALLLLDQTDMELTCIDRCSESCSIAEKLVDASDHRSVDFNHVDILGMDSMEQWDVIFVSVLAGVGWNSDEQTRLQMIQSIVDRAKPGAMLILRTAYALGQLIYPSVERAIFNTRQVVEIKAPVIGRSSLILVNL